MSDVSGPGRYAAVVAPSDVTIIPLTRYLWIGVTGNLTLTMADGSFVQFLNVPVGKFEIQCTQVRAATTATSIVAVW